MASVHTLEKANFPNIEFDNKKDVFRFLIGDLTCRLIKDSCPALVNLDPISATSLMDEDGKKIMSVNLNYDRSPETTCATCPIARQSQATKSR